MKQRMSTKIIRKHTNFRHRSDLVLKNKIQNVGFLNQVLEQVEKLLYSEIGKHYYI